MTTVSTLPLLSALLAERGVSIGLFSRLGHTIRGVVHVGANNGYEIPFYWDLGATRVLAFEPLESAFDSLVAKFGNDPRVEMKQMALSDQSGLAKLHVSPGDGMGSSLLRPTEAAKYDIVATPSVIMRRLDSLHLNFHPYNTLVIDVQGAELAVLVGMGEELGNFDLLCVECARVPLYEGGVPASEVIDFLRDEGFDWITDIAPEGDGDVLFVRRGVHPEKGVTLPPEVKEYVPEQFHYNGLPLPRVPTSWDGLEKIIPDIMTKFNVKRNLCVEFGCWHGYSTAALANNFGRVVGVEPFTGDKLKGTENVEMIVTTGRTLSPWGSRVRLVPQGYKEFLEGWPTGAKVDLVHIDIIHTYAETLSCGYMTIAAMNPKVVLFHDTISFPEVMETVTRLAQVFNRKFYNYPLCHGLGILVREDS